MTKPWTNISPTDSVRPADTFAPFPKALPNPDGHLDQWLEHTAVVTLCAREWKCKQGWRVGPRMLNDTLWYWFENGSGWYSLGKDGPRKTFRAGDLLLIPQGMEHTVELYRGRGVRHISAHFHAHVFSNINLLTLLGFPCRVSATPHTPFGAASIALTREYAIQSVGWKRAMANHVFNVLLYVIRHYGPLFRPLGGAPHQLLPRLLPALELIEQQLDNPSLAIGDLAQKVGVSEVYLRRLFRTVTGLGPAAFIQRRRIERACTLLRQTSTNIKQIAANTGFGDLTFFYHVFKCWTGITPVAYRKDIEEFATGNPHPATAVEHRLSPME
ncbi:MAG: AraC family transcriptional regulator [Verrucomicrobiota bacterium]